MQIIDTSLLLPVPWKNGGGETRTVSVSPEGAGFDDFVWRVSIADVRESGNFSRFPGVDRTIVLLDGGGMMLNGPDGAHHPLAIPFQPWSMRGDDAVTARLLNGSARDFNVMVRRGSVQATVQVWQTQQTLAPHTGDAVFYCARGAFRISVPGCEDVRLATGFALRITDFAAGLSAQPEHPDSILIGTLLNFTK